MRMLERMLDAEKERKVYLLNQTTAALVGMEKSHLHRQYSQSPCGGSFAAVHVCSLFSRNFDRFT